MGEAARATAAEGDGSEHASPAAVSDAARRYPDYLMPVAGQADALGGGNGDSEAAARERYERFCELREEALLGYGYNTARAYWGDLDDIYRWAERRGFDFFALTDAQFKQYIALLRRRKYAEGTIRRRLTAFRMLFVGQARVGCSGGRRRDRSKSRRGRAGTARGAYTP